MCRRPLHLTHGFLMLLRHSAPLRNTMLNGLVAALACVITLMLTAGPALAESGDVAGSNLRGRVAESAVRYDITAACQGIERQLQKALEPIRKSSHREGTVSVEAVMEGGAIKRVSATGLSNDVERSVRKAVRALQCGAPTTGVAQVYHFRIQFIERDAETTALGPAQSDVRLAVNAH